MWDVVEFSNVKKQEGNYTYISKLVKKFKIDTSHFVDQRGGNRKEKGLDEYLVEGKFLTFPRLAKVAIFTTNVDAENEC